MVTLNEDEEHNKYHPVNLMSKKLRILDTKLKQEEYQKWLDLCYSHLEHAISHPNCLSQNKYADPRKQAPTKCSCMKQIEHDNPTKNAVARFMCEYSRKKNMKNKTSRSHRFSQ